MDIETENITKLIYPNGVPDEYKENPDFYAYLNKLGGYSVEQLSKEPDHLQAEKNAVLNQTQDLAFTNYKAFIQTAECSREIFDQFNKTEARLDSLINRIPEFSTECEKFVSSAHEIKSKRRLNTVCLTKHSAVLQILEVPQLMETVIREGMYDEALQLAAYVRRLGKTHSSIPIIQWIVADCDKMWGVLVHRLVAQLKSELQLPRCLQLVGHLRRMELLSELDLRLKFLQARDAWFQSLLSSIPTDDPSHHLAKTVELSRTHLFNIITQYKAVFTEEESSVSTGKHIDDYPILTSWINNKVDQFLITLKKDLAECGGGNISSILGQCMYFGQSLSRVGADFRALIVPIFTKTILDTFTSSLSKATSQFLNDMDKFSLSSVSPSIGHKVFVDEEQKSQLAPPAALLHFYPLSYGCNNILGALNELRLCAPLSLASQVTNTLTQTLSTFSNIIAQFYRREQQALSDEERDSFTRFCVVFADSLLPYIQRCLNAIYSPIEIASYLGVTVHLLQQQGLTFFDNALILEPIKGHLPPRMPSQVAQIIEQAQAPAAPTESVADQPALSPVETQQEPLI